MDFGRLEVLREALVAVVAAAVLVEMLVAEMKLGLLVPLLGMVVLVALVELVVVAGPVVEWLLVKTALRGLQVLVVVAAEEEEAAAAVELPALPVELLGVVDMAEMVAKEVMGCSLSFTDDLRSLRSL